MNRLGYCKRVAKRGGKTQVRGVLPSRHTEPPRAVEVPSELTPGFERVATWLSAACAVHCLLVPVASAVLPLLGASGSAFASGPIEHAFNAVVIVGALLALVVGYRRHRDVRIALAIAVALLVYFAGHALDGQRLGLGLSIVGGLALAGASFWSARLGHAHGAHCEHPASFREPPV